MDLVERVKAICFKPKETWAVIKDEQTTVKELFTSYAAILALIPPLASFIGLSLVGMRITMMGTWRQPVLNGLVHAAIYYVLSLVGAYFTAWVANRLAPNFNSRQDLTGAVKAVVFSYTPVWVASVLNIIPGLSILVVLAGFYSLYVFYLGLPAMMDTPPEKRVIYVFVVILVSVAAMFLVSMIAGLFLTSIHVGARGLRL